MISNVEYVLDILKIYISLPLNEILSKTLPFGIYTVYIINILSSIYITYYVFSWYFINWRQI